MKLSQLLEQVSVNHQIVQGESNIDLEFNDIAQDSRGAKSDSIFFALKGAAFDAVKFIPQVIEFGVKIIFVHDGYDQDYSTHDLVIIKSNQIGDLLAQCLKIFYSDLPKNIYAVTGTNGKTSVADFARQSFELLGIKSASIGTLGVIANSIDQSKISKSALTTPDIVTLYKNLTLLKKHQINHVIIEVSSIALDQGRVNGIEFAASIFTNLTQDHLDYHGSMDSYFDSKMLLFKQFTAKDSPAIINSDIDQFPKIQEICNKSDLNISDFGFKADAFKIISINQIDHGQEVVFSYLQDEYKFQINLYGEFNVYNILSVIALIISTKNLDKPKITEFLSTLLKINSANGRVEKVATLKNSAQIFIDFAHTPDALEKVLKLSRHFTKNRLIILFGCGGDRDAGKRPQMGKIANDLADVIIVTDDNPRSEDPTQIRQEIIAVCDSSKAVEKSDRKNAIKYAISILESGDVLILAGKGHEKYQITKDGSIDFDEEQIVKEIINQLGV